MSNNWYKSWWKKPFPPKVIRKKPTFIPFEQTPEGVALQKSMNRGFNLGTVIAAGNYETRNFRQKPLVVLQTATHTPNPNRKMPQKVVPVVVPKNTLLRTSTTMPVVYKKAFPAKKVSKSATNRKNVNSTKSKPKTVTQELQKEVKSLKQAINTINSRHTYKSVTTGTLKSLVGRCNYTGWSGVNSTNLETWSANLRFYDPANPGTLVTANPNTGSYARDIHFKNVYMKMLIRNNYQVPVRIKIYLCKVKNDTNDPVMTTYTNAITDQVINASIDETDATLFLNDIERVKETWSIDCVVDGVLEPGKETLTTHSTGPIQYDPSHTDQNTDNYQKVHKSFQFVVRIEGVLGHDTTVTTEQTLLQAGVDIMSTIKADIEYNSGGADLDDIYINDGRAQAFTNGGVVSLKPVADNIAYSVS